MLRGKRVLLAYIGFAAAFFSLIILATLTPTNTTQAQSLARIPGNTCQQIITAAFDRLTTYCNGLGRNNACYGNSAVQAEFSSESQLRFDSVGDMIPVRLLRSLSVSPFDLDNGLWGLSLLKLQANIPDTLPGQNVLFLVYGNTNIENAGGNMQSFYFTSGLGSQECQEAPQDSIMVRSPNHMKVTFKANGVDITIASTLVMRAERNKQMSLTLLEGHGTIATAFGSQEILPGQRVTVQLGGANGLEASSAPSTPVAVTPDATSDSVVCLMDHLEGKLCKGEVKPSNSSSNVSSTAVPPVSQQSSSQQVQPQQPAPINVVPVIPTVNKYTKSTKVPKPTYVPKPHKSRKHGKG